MTARILTIVGARPQFIKAATLSRQIARAPGLSELIVHTGQHFDTNMSSVFFEELGMERPDRHLGISGGRHGEMTGRMLIGIEAALVEDRPDAVLVYGDTNSTLAGALAAAKLGLPVIHVEAGLRSFNRRMPEEVNRVMTDHVSDLLLCPTRRAVDNLAREGIVAGVRHVGDVMYDAVLFARGQTGRSAILDRLGLRDRAFSLCTLHRQETVDDPEQLDRALSFIEAQARDRLVVFPVHPRTRLTLGGRNPRNVNIIDPVGYLDMQALLAGCSLVLTDSGGIQKEAYFHRKPCITLRNETEWVETIEAGWNRLWTVPEWISPRRDIPDFGAGDSAQQCVEAISAFLGQASSPAR